MSKTPPEKQAEIRGGQKPQWYCDYLLVQSILDGNTHIWDILYRKTYPIVYCYTRRIHAKWHISEDQVADVADETFTRCFAKLNTYMGKSKFSTWACGFTRYILLKRYHKYTMYNKYAFSIYSASHTIRCTSNPENAVIIKERNICIWTAFRSLTIKHQALLKYYVLKEINAKQVKAITKLSAGKRKEELAVAVSTLRNRYLALYEKLTY